MPVTLGFERLIAERTLTGARIGLVCNPASVGGDLCHVADRFMADAGVELAALFGPQHGIHADVQDNMIETPHGRDTRRRVPVYSLYSDTREPTAAMLDGLDALVVDLPDIGARIYTFIYTMANCLRAAARRRLPVVVCDRPNPIGGVEVEGPVLEPGYESFVGQFPIPMRHGMTIGELARLFNDRFAIGCELRVAPMAGWQRTLLFGGTGLPWVLPSPNMPTPESAMVYPGTVLFEGTNLSEGRGTTRPFELVGAPWIEPAALRDALEALDLPGVRFRAASFQPTFQKHASDTCGGVQIHVVDPGRYRPVLTGVAALIEMRRQSPGRFAWRQPPYEYEHEKLPIDILAGSPALRESIEAGAAARDIARSWEQGEERFRTLRRQYLLYE
jgi:uncharacterized protein YbbC (DUF1343 family)